MKELYTKLKRTKLFNFIRNQWWLAIVIFIVTFMFTGVPNVFNSNRVNGVIERTYIGNYHAAAYGGTSVDFETVFIVLKDSTKYNCSAQAIIDLFRSIDGEGKQVSVIYSGSKSNDRMITRLLLDGELIFDESLFPLYILYFSLLWILIGGGGELVRLWRSV